MPVKYLSCNGLGLSPTQVISGLLQSSSHLPEGFGFVEQDAVFTYQGRYAVHLICQLLQIGAGDEVIVPAYNCGAEIDPFVWAGAKVIFYRIDEHAAIDIADIIRHVTPATKIIYVAHFFGWPQEMEALVKLCKEKGLFLVEDCALCLFSKGPNNTIGHAGDAAIYSFVKSLPVPDGGALVLKNKNIWTGKTPCQQPHFNNICRNVLPLFKKGFMNDNKFWQRYKVTRKMLNKSWLKESTAQDHEIEREMPKGNYFDSQKIGWSISKLSKGIISKINPHKIVEQRRRNYNYLHNALQKLSVISFLFDYLPDNVCPLAFPIYVHDRNRWADELEGRGILVGGWPSYHGGFNWNDFPEARHLKNDLLTLPVHQALKLEHMTYIAECVYSIAESHGRYHSR